MVSLSWSVSVSSFLSGAFTLRFHRIHVCTYTESEFHSHKRLSRLIIIAHLNLQLELRIPCMQEHARLARTTANIEYLPAMRQPCTETHKRHPSPRTRLPERDDEIQQIVRLRYRVEHLYIEIHTHTYTHTYQSDRTVIFERTPINQCVSPSQHNTFIHCTTCIFISL